jgi:ribose/xylose/arabinose/galactoside ABC-type transport system permease subunit
MLSTNNFLLVLLQHPLISGLLAGVVHHVLVQYPRQKPLFFTLYAMLFANLAFTAAILVAQGGTTDASIPELLQKLKTVVFFNLSFVTLAVRI